jgi:choline dehydrogenase-like flavoprotein
MLRDFRLFDGDGPIECDVCIAGAGAAGVTLALTLARERLKVVLLEAGGLDYEAAVQASYEGEIVGRDYHALSDARLRYLGGSTNHWGGMCTPLEPHDFEPRPWVPQSGWPIDFETLAPWYREAHPWLELGAFDYAPEHLLADGSSLLAVDAARLRHKMWHYSRPPTNFGVDYRAELEASPVDLLLHASLVGIRSEPGGTAITGFEIANLAGRRGEVRARTYVLALGGLETPRLLLHVGLGNQRDLVGRFFMEHLNVDAGHIVTAGDDGWPASYDALFRGERQYRAFLLGSPAFQAKEAVLGSAACLGPLSAARDQSEGYGSLHELKMAWLRGRMPDHLGRHVWNMVTDPGGLAAAFRERFDPTVFLQTEAEQAPNPASRVTLGDQQDAFGLPRIRLDWRLGEIDKRSIRKLALLIGQLGVGRLNLPPWLEDDRVQADDPILGGYHHMGTTRMAVDPSAGVVDADCRLFGTANLYIAGSSVFPTGGCANPTLTIVALTLRLARHIAERRADS